MNLTTRSLKHRLQGCASLLAPTADGAPPNKHANKEASLLQCLGGYERN